MTFDHERVLALRVERQRLASSPRSRHRWALAVCAGWAVLGASSTLRAQPAGAVIPPGQDALAAEMLGGGAALPGGCRWAGASVQAREVVSRYACGTPERAGELVLAHPAEATAESLRTARFSVTARPPGALPPELLAAVASRVREREAAWRWIEPEVAVRRADPYPRRVVATLVAIALALAAGGALTVVGRRRRAPLRPPDASPARREAFASLAALSVALAAALVMAMVARFRFAFDDYTSLIGAADEPWSADPCLRVVSTSALFRIGVLLGASRVPFALANLTALGGAAWLWASLLRRAGMARDETALAAALIASAPGLFELLRWASGFQQLAALAVVLGVVRLFDAAAREADSRWRRRGLLLLSLGLASLGAFVKYPVMAVVPVACWLWGRWVVRDAPAPLRRHAFYLSYVAAVTAPVVIAWSSGVGRSELDKSGLARLGPNLVTLAALLQKPVLGIATAVLLLLLWPVVVRRLSALRSGPDGPRAPGPRPAFAAPLAGARALLVRAWEVLRDALAPRAGVASLGALALALSAAWAAPFLLNALYFAPYYALPVFLPLTAVAARWLLRAQVRGGGAWPAAVIAAAALAPVSEVRINTAADPYNDVQAFVEAVAGAVRGRDRPERIVLTSGCGEASADARATEELGVYMRSTEGGRGVAWATGWHDVGVAVRAGEDASDRRPQELVVRYCRGQPTRAEPSQ